LPVLDEWFYIAPVLGQDPLSAEFLWQQHNEHRIPLAKLSFRLLLPLMHMNYRTLAFVNLALMASAAVLLLFTVRRLRGHFAMADVAIPLACLSYGHFENLTWGFQIAFCQFAFLACSVASDRRYRHDDYC